MLEVSSWSSDFAEPSGQSLKTNSSLMNIGAAGAVALGESLKINVTLRNLALSRNNIGAAGAVALTAGLQETFAPGQHRRRRGTGTGVTDAVLIEPKSCQTAAKPWRMRRRGRKNAVRIFGSGGSEKMAWRNQHRRTTSVLELWPWRPGCKSILLQDNIGDAGAPAPGSPMLF